MKRSTTIFIGTGVVIVILIAILGSSYNGLVSKQEAVHTAWGQVENVYQRRMDLIPNLVATVKGYAAHEKSTFVDVVNARAKATGSLGQAAFQDPKKFQQFQQAQAQLGSALSRLLVVVERYPDLKASQNFLTLQSQLEGTENRIAVERRRYNLAAQAYNTTIRVFPHNIIAHLFGFTEVQYFKAHEGADVAPKVQF